MRKSKPYANLLRILTRFADLAEAESNMQDLISEYVQYQEASVDEEPEGEYEEEVPEE